MDGLKRLGPEKAPAGDRDLPDLGQLSGQAFDRLPLPAAIGLLEDGAEEPEILHANEAFAQLVGGPVSPDRRCRLGHIAWEGRSSLQRRRAAARFAEGEGFSETLVLTAADGGTVRGNCQWTPMAADPGGGRYWSVAITVQTAESARAEVLRGSADSLAAIFEYSQVDICLKDVEGRYILVSKRFEEIYDTTNEAVYGKLPKDVGVGAAWAEQVRQADLEVLRTGKPLAQEEVIPLRNGTIEGFTVKFPLISASGELEGIGTICTDITERRAAERALLASEREAASSKALLSEAIESMTDGFVWFDSEGRLVLCNQKYRDLYPKLAGELRAGAAYSDLMKTAFDRDQFTVMAGAEDGAIDTEVGKVFRRHPTFRDRKSVV